MVKSSVKEDILHRELIKEIISLLLQTTLPEFEKQEFSVVRQQEEFVWLHDRFEENEEYAGFIVSYVIIGDTKGEWFFSPRSF